MFRCYIVKKMIDAKNLRLLYFLRIIFKDNLLNSPVTRYGAYLYTV